jgi:hypothetical protein
VDSFPSTFTDEPYSCIIGHIERTPQLVDGHARLSLLPHIDTFWDYKPHLTLGYVHQDHEASALMALGNQVTGVSLTFRGLNYGRLETA